MPVDTTVNLALCLLIPLAIGLAAARVLFKEFPFGRVGALAVSFGLGMGIITHWMLLLSVLGISYTRENISIPLVMVALGILFLVAKKRRGREGAGSFLISDSSRQEPESSRTIIVFLKNLVGIIVIGYVVWQFYFILWRSLNIPLFAWDEISTIGSKAKCIFVERSIVPLKNYIHASYPLHVPLSLGWVALNLGYWDEQLVKIIFPVIFMSASVIYYIFLRHQTNRWWALLGLGLLVSANFPVYHAAIAYRDIYLMYYNISAVLFLSMGCEQKNDRFFVLAGLFMGFATFTKLEATGYLVVNALAFVDLLFLIGGNTVKEKALKFLKFFVPGGGIYLIYFLYRCFHGLRQGQGRFGWDFAWDHWNRVPLILEKFLGNVFLSGNWNILWFLLLVSLIVYRRTNAKRLSVKYLLLCCLAYFGVYFAVALFTPNFVSFGGLCSSYTVSRVILHFFPLCPILIILLNCPKTRQDRKGP